MSFIKSLFSNKESIKEVTSVMTGVVKDITEAPDQAFAQKLLGDGFVVFPTSGEVVAPFDGKIAMVYPTKHAIGLMSDSGLEVLIHVGLDTVNLEGQGFELLVQVDDKVRRGQKILKVDLEFIKSKEMETATPVIITNLNGQAIELKKTGNVSAGEVVLIVK